jgi:decaprenyl-phosphate phosphoribosyltransferase
MKLNFLIYFHLIRIKQWVKNLFVFAPIFFAAKIGDLLCWELALIPFLSFCFAASSIYCLNDIIDLENDKKHPTKKFRPLASGKIKVNNVICLSFVLFCLSLCSASIPLLLPFNFTLLQATSTLGLTSIYLFINVLYCFKLKNYPLIDVTTISSGFVLRLISGGLICQIWISPWIVCLTFLLTLFLAFAKRRDDVILMADKTNNFIRNSATNYNEQFLDQTLSITASVTLVCYITYSISPDVIERFNCEYLYISSFFVLLGLLKYLQITIVNRKSGNPTKVLLKSRTIQCCVLFWLLFFALIIYL